MQTLDRDTLGDLQGGRLSYALKLSRHCALNIIVIGDISGRRDSGTVSQVDI